MTAGAGICHSEESPPGHSAVMHGVQLWVALPEPARSAAPRDFTQYRDLPVIARDGLCAVVIVGELEGVVTPATTYSPLMGAELTVEGQVEVGLRKDYEYGVLALEPVLTVDGRPLGVSEIGYVGAGRDCLRLGSDGPVHALLLGGEPFTEKLVMWWNFIGRSHDEVVEFRQAWNAESDQFGAVVGFEGDRLPAPPMPGSRLKSRGRERRQPFVAGRAPSPGRAPSAGRPGRDHFSPERCRRIDRRVFRTRPRRGSTSWIKVTARPPRATAPRRRRCRRR